MKKILIFVAFVILTLICTGCKKNNRGLNEPFILSQKTANPTPDHIPQSTTSVIPTQEITIETGSIPTPEELKELSKDFKPASKVDIDLSTMSSTMIYAQVFNMLIMPDEYVGKNLKMKGYLAVYVNKDTGKKYFSVIVPDATACCQQGLEFIWIGDHKYPEDYPPFEKEITVTGKFATTYSTEGALYTFIQAEKIEF